MRWIVDSAVIMIILGGLFQIFRGKKADKDLMWVAGVLILFIGVGPFIIMFLEYLIVGRVQFLGQMYYR